MGIFVEIKNYLCELIGNNCNIAMTSVTMVIGIVAGWFTTLGTRRRLISTLIASVIFSAISYICYPQKETLILACIISVVWLVLSILVFRAGEVGRWGIGRLIIKFTDSADKERPICIFGGDLNFFGKYITPKPYRNKILLFIKKNKYIETNNQYTQIRDNGFREVKILAIKPYSNTQKDIETRIRIGYIANELKERVQIKFFDAQLCDGCKDYNSCVTCDCNNCAQKNKCKNQKKKCPKLETSLANACYNPDVTLRGRIVNKKDSKSKCVAIATTKKAGKKYILREYSASENECTLYTVIWDVWWSKCKFDPAFIQRCIDEYLAYREKENK